MKKFLVVFTIFCMVFALSCSKSKKGKNETEIPDSDEDVIADIDGNTTPDDDTDSGEIEETENHKISGAYQIGSEVSDLDVALVECGKTDVLASDSTDNDGKFSFNADISSTKSYCVRAKDFASCFKGLSDHTANISEITNAVLLLDPECSDLRKSETKIRAYTKLGTGEWLGELDYSKLSGISEGLKLLSSYLKSTDSKNISEKIAADVKGNLEFRKFFDGFRILADRTEVVIDESDPAKNEVRLNIEGGSKTVAPGFSVSWTAMNKTAEGTEQKVSSTNPGEYVVRAKLVSDGGDPIMLEAGGDPIMISENSKTLLYLLEGVSGTIDVSDMSKHVSHYIDHGIYAVIPKNTVIKNGNSPVTKLTYKIIKTGDGSRISRIEFGPEGTTFTGDSLYFIYELGTVFGGDPIMLSATRTNSDGSSNVLQSAGGDPIMLEAGGDPIMFSAGGDPIMQIARSAGGDPIMQSAAGDPIMNSAAGDPIMSAAAGDPIMTTTAAGDPIMSTAAGDPIMMGTSSSVMIAKTGHFSGFSLDSATLPVPVEAIVSRWCDGSFYQGYSPVEFIKKGVEKYKADSSDKEELLSYLTCGKLADLGADLDELMNREIGYQRNLNLFENLFFVSEFYSRMKAKKAGGAVAAVKNGLDLRSAIAALYTATTSYNRSATLADMFDSSMIPLTYSGVIPEDYSAEAKKALTGKTDESNKYAATKKEMMIFANYITTSSKGPDFSGVSAPLTADQLVCAWFNPETKPAECGKVYAVNEAGHVTSDGVEVTVEAANEIFTKFFMPFNTRLSDSEKLGLFKTLYLALRYAGTVFYGGSELESLNEKLLETAYLVFDGINRNANAVTIVDTFDASAHTVQVLEGTDLETKPYIAKVSALTDKIYLKAAASAEVEKVLVKIEGHAFDKVTDNTRTYYKPKGALKEKSIVLAPGTIEASLKPLKELLGSENVDEPGNVTGKVTVVATSKISGKTYSTQKVYEFLANSDSDGVETKPVSANLTVFLYDSESHAIPASANPGMILNPGNKALYPDSTGKVKISGLAPASYTIDAFADGFYAKNAAVNVSAGADFSVEIRLDKEVSGNEDANLELQVKINTEKHPSKVYIQIYDEAMELVANESAKFSGNSYEKLNIRINSGRYTLLAVGEEMYDYLDAVTVYAGNNAKEITVVAKNACGNGIVDSAEECEPSVSGSNLEVRCGDIYPAATHPDKKAACNKATCTFDKSQCGKASVCGDGVIDNGEGCDGGSKACSEISGFGSSSGMAPCAANCSDWITKDNCSRKSASCGTLPENALWNDGLGKFSQTYNGSKWMPETPEPAAGYGLTRDECVFSCKKGYKWNENTRECLPDPLSLANICTGEKKCFNNTSATSECPAYGSSFFGQDAQYAKEGYCTAHSFEISGDIVVDSFTHYEWQKTASPSAMTWAQADAYCSDLNVGSGSSASWRIPAPQELLTIIDSNRFNPALDTAFFTASAALWAKEDAKNPGNAWIVTADGALESVADSDSNHVLCVRINDHDTASERFEEADETVRDTESGLMWLKNYTSSKTWQEALSHCENSIAGGQTDWRLPNRNELASLIDYTENSGVMSAFPGIAAKEFWSSTTSTSEPAKAWPVDFESGRIIADSKSETHYVLCVRNDSACFGDDCADPCRFDPCRNTVNSTGVCTAEEDGNGYSCVCYSGYEWKAGLSKCVLHDEITKGCDIDKLPENAVWNTVGTITQYPDGHGNWYPSTVPEYNETPSTSECRFKCREQYFWDYDSQKCFTGKKTDTCKGQLPPNAERTVFTIVQEWDPGENDYMPRVNDLEYGENENENKCTFHCKEHYSYSNNACEAAQQTVNCTLPSHAEWNPASGGTVTQTWTESNGWQPPVEVIYSETPGTNNQCHYKCESSYFWNSSSKTCESPCDSRPCDNIQHSTGVCSALSLGQYECGCDEYYYWNGKCSKIVTLGNICTGMNKCYNDDIEITCPTFSSDDFYGQDAQHTNKCTAQSFSSSSNVVVDNNTNLTWEKSPSADTYTWENSATHCNDLNSSNYGGKSNWRVPNPLELFTIADSSKYNLATNSIFTNMPTGSSDGLWTSKERVNEYGSLLAGLFHPFDGTYFYQYTDDTYKVLCVSGDELTAAASSDFTISSDGKTVTDNRTGLMWQKEYVADKKWQEALQYCEYSTYAGYNDWRLPNKNELLSLFDPGKSGAPYSNFPDMPSNEFWSSTPKVSQQTIYAWTVPFDKGFVNASYKPGWEYVRCVR